MPQTETRKTCDHPEKNAASYSGHPPLGALWYAEGEAVGTFSSVLASHRQPDRRYMQRMWVLSRTSDQTTEASQVPMDDV